MCFQKLAKVMTFLHKFYFLDTATLYKNFGRTLERLMAHGDLQIRSWTSSIIDAESGNTDYRIRVSVFMIDSFDISF